ncbi:MAG: UDP-N-acetylmuramoyl-tripeptide--D-alanyl-D-alanine ligase, partial [Rickettsiaceae bacterium]|nr:UDP-N-acetylmuramoyl-tripeptide--D-alanyl-D-alanine ligase [Rickettsiaceae bacterium]
LKIETEASGNIVHFNSNDILPGDIFIAMGAGHNYIEQALANGASCVIAEQISNNIDDRIIIVPNSEKALHMMASYKRAKSKAKFIGVTGSAGKTSTKEILYHIFKNFGKSFVSRGNFNNHIGVPLNLASMPDDVEFAIFEMGMNHKGEIRPLAELVKPDIGIITNIYDVHIGHFGSAAEIAEEKSNIFYGMNENGIAILYKDNPYFEACCEFSRLKRENIYSFGSNHADANLVKYESDGYESKLEFRINGKIIKAKAEVTGLHQATNMTAALLLVDILGLDVKKAADSILQLKHVKGRGEKIKAEIGRNECVIINDCYNANPAAVRYSLATFKEIEHPNKIVILADMGELGENEIAYHRNLAPEIIDSGANYFYSVGPLMAHLFEEVKEEISSKHFRDYMHLQSEIENLITKPSIILLKGSKSTKLISVVDFLTKQKEK